MIALLLGAEAGVQGEMIGRVAGVALVAIGVACAGAAADAGGPAQTGTIAAITIYNAGAGALLLLYAATGNAIGAVVWAVGVLHVAFATVLGINSLTRRTAHRLA